MRGRAHPTFRSPYGWHVAAMFRRKSNPQESSARLWWGLAVAYLASVLVYISIEWVYLGATFWTALIEGVFAMVFPVAGLRWMARRNSFIKPK